MSDYDYDDDSSNQQFSSYGCKFLDQIETFQDLELWKLENGYDSDWGQLQN